MNNNNSKKCPICGKTYYEAPALSRKDNKTLICSECGIREALHSIGISLAEQELLINAVYNKVL